MLVYRGYSLVCTLSVRIIKQRYLRETVCHKKYGETKKGASDNDYGLSQGWCQLGPCLPARFLNAYSRASLFFLSSHGLQGTKQLPRHALHSNLAALVIAVRAVRPSLGHETEIRGELGASLPDSCCVWVAACDVASSSVFWSQPMAHRARSCGAQVPPVKSTTVLYSTVLE